MKKKQTNTLVFIYNSFNDPLFQNLVLSYIKTLSSQVSGDFRLITFEQPRYQLTRSEREYIRKDLARFRIYWHPLTFHTGKFLLIKKFWDFLTGLGLVLTLRLRYRLNVVFCFANVSAAMGVLMAKLLRMRMIVFSYEPHAHFLLELGLWNRQSLKFKILSYLEKLAGKKADYILTGTQYMVDELAPLRKPGSTFRAPTAVDEQEFAFRADGRARVRNLLDWHNKEVIIYIGKFGGLYYTNEIAIVCQAIAQKRHQAVFLIVTSNDHSYVSELFEQYLSPEKFLITGNLSYDEVKDYLSAADMGISGVPPTPSQRFRSPTKVAEYLLCGLPYITTKGVSEDDIVAEENKVGVVLDYFDQSEVDVHYPSIEALLDENRDNLRARCRRVGLSYRSRETVIQVLSHIYKDLEQLPLAERH